MSASHARAVFERYLAAVNGGDADALDDVLHPDFQDFYPQSGERTRGAENLKHITGTTPVATRTSAAVRSSAWRTAGS